MNRIYNAVIPHDADGLPVHIPYNAVPVPFYGIRMPFGIIEIFQIVALEIQDGSVVIIIIIVTTVNIGLKMILVLTPVNLKNVLFPYAVIPPLYDKSRMQAKNPVYVVFHAGLDETVLFGNASLLSTHPEVFGCSVFVQILQIRSS
jgi:hypothetical protein